MLSQKCKFECDWTAQLTMSEKVLKILKDLEKKHNIKFLLAVEGGSRATGLEAPDSDYDCRCIYVHPLDWYLQVQDDKPLPLDIIYNSTTDNVDIKATEFRKALRLIRQSNPPLLEWLQSDVIYHQTDVIVELRKLVSQYFSKEKLAFHYNSIAKTNWVIENENL
jgi:predicted nucleotidyltransferase